MAHKEQRDFCERVKEKFPSHFKNKKVLDVGSLDINGSNNYLFENCTYIGLDLAAGKNVDTIGVGHLYDGPDEYFDTIISTEVFEHDMFYEETILNIIRMLKPGGMFLFTCASTGRPEHGTRRTGGFDAPLLIQISEEWADYYKNLTEDDIRKVCGFNTTFPDGYFQFKDTNIEIPSDLYFFGIKGGSKYLTEPTRIKNTDEIFVVNSWINNDSKELDLINLIKRLKGFNTPILLTGHYPVKQEVQNMVDYYLFDKNNPLLMSDEFVNMGVNSVRWTQIYDTRVENHRQFHHDYAIWESMRLAFEFCKDLGKTKIHFMEYDNLPDEQQYRQAFIEYLDKYDAVVYEYNKGSTMEENPYCATYIFSIKTDVALKVINSIKTKEDFFKNKPNRWQLEKNFYQTLRSITPHIHICDYIPNDNEFNTQVAWDGERISEPFVQFYLAVDNNENLYIHTISGTGEKSTSNDYLLEVVYNDYKKFHKLFGGKYDVYTIDKYKTGSTVRVYHQGIEIYRKFLGENVMDFYKFNNFITGKSYEPKEVQINFIDGPFVEIKDDIKKRYHVEFIDSKTGLVDYGTDIESNHWCKPNKKYYMDWLIKIKGIDNDYYYEHKFDITGKRVLISFESKSLGDTLAWISQVERFAIENDAVVICSTFHNRIFRNIYSNIIFVEPGSTVNDIYALFRIGIFRNGTNIDEHKHRRNPLLLPLGEVASDILGMNYIEIKPNIPIFATEKKKVVSIATHATAQCKYWNNPTGWQDVVDYLNSNGYEVKLLSREEDGYMGNTNPKNVTKVRSGSIENIIKILQESELFIGISSGLSWLSWAVGTETILISGFTDDYTEPRNGVKRVINKNVCHGCWSHYMFDPSDWNWCPIHKGTDSQFQCSKLISSEDVIKEIKSIIKGRPIEQHQ